MQALFASLEEFELVGQAASGEEAVERVEQLRPDVVLMDIQMPGVNGIEATRRLLKEHPEVGVIVVTMLEEDESVFAAMKAGARGYVVKGAGQADVLRAIRAVAEGEAVFGPGIAARLKDFFGGLRPPTQDPFPELTDREREVLDLIARGLNKAQIAEELTIAPKTVSNHLSNIYNKLRVADRAEAMLRARQAGLGKAE